MTPRHEAAVGNVRPPAVPECQSAAADSKPATSSQTVSDERLAELFKALAHPVRVSLMRRLRGGRRYCGDLVAEFDLAQSTISHHLRILREAGLIAVEEQGTRTCYTINEQTLHGLCRQFVAMSGTDNPGPA